MKVMMNHDWKDEGIDHVDYDPSGGMHKETRRIFLNDTYEGSIVISKEDTIALAKEFDLVVYEDGSNL